MSRKRGRPAQLSPEYREILRDLVARNVSTSKIMEQLKCTRQLVSIYRRQARGIFDRTREPGESRIAQLCLVNECHEKAVTGGKYCGSHEHTPGQHGAQSHAPMARLMGSR